MACDSNLCSYFPPSIDRDLHGFGVFNADISLEMESTFSSDLSSGYLEDAIVAWSNRCKRRRMLSYSPDQVAGFSKNCWNSNVQDYPFENFGCFRQNYTSILEENPLKYWVNDVGNESTAPAEMKTVEPEHLKYHSSTPSFHMESKIEDPHEKDPSVSKGDSCRMTKVAYPFDMVKPGGVEGDVTLDDINERMLMRPTRPVRHPVGDLACRPCVTTGGLGLSGKAVVALTRIRTRGRGTVTIIRTRG